MRPGHGRTRLRYEAPSSVGESALHRAHRWATNFSEHQSRTHYSSRRQDDVDARAWPVFSQHALDLLRSFGEVLHPEPGELLWDAGDPYDLYLVLAGGVLLLDRRDDRVVFVIEEGDFVGELGMLMGQRAFLPGVAMEGTAVLRVRVEELRRLMEISGELSDVVLSAFDARRRLLKRMGEGGLVLAGDDDRDLHRLQEFAAQPTPLPDGAAFGRVGLVRAGEHHCAA